MTPSADLEGVARPVSHTQGRLIVRGGFSLYAEDRKTPVADACLNASIAAHDEGNARRLAACWNACEGVETELLEAYPAPFTALVSERDRLSAQVAENLQGMQALAGRVRELEAALQAAGDLAASSRSGPAKAESLLGIEEIATQALEHRGVRLAAPQAVQDIANEICQAVAELPDRNSPEDWPEAMLVTHDELQFIVTEAIAALTTTSGDSHG